MRWWNEVWFRLRALLGRTAMERDLDDEFRFHLEMETKKLVAGGMTPAEARRVARVRFGGEERFKEQARGSWGVAPLTDLGGDIRYAARQFAQHPAFNASAALTLALGIGGTVALFSVVYGLMIRPLPIPDEDRVVTFWMDFNWRGEEFDLVKEVPSAFAAVAAYSNEAYTLRSDAGSSLVLATVASVELWDVLGVAPFLGRTFQPGEDRPGATPVVVLSYGAWTREFGSDPAILGRSIEVDGVQRAVVGVMPEGFYFPTPEMELFLPLNLDPADPGYANNGWLVLAGRLRPDATEAELGADLAAVTRVLGDRYDYPAVWDKTRDPYTVSLREYLLGDIRPALVLLLTAVGLLLLMACVNVAALLLTRTVDRTHEMSLRAALGAGRGRLARQVLTESLLLGLVAGMLGMGLAAALFNLLVAGLPIDPAFRGTLHLDWTALVTALGLAVLTGSLVALAPVRDLLRGELAEGALASRTEGAGGAHAGRVQRGLVIAEVLLAVMLVTGASLLVRTVDRLRDIDAGLDPSGVLTLDVLVSQEETTEAERAAFFGDLVARASALPGVSTAGLINRLPLRDGGYQGPVTIDDRPDLAGVSRPNVMYRPVTPAAFATLGMELIRGRGIEATDLIDGPLVAVVNETFARRIWGAEDPIGRIYTTGFVGSVRVVGVVRDVAVTDLIGEQPAAAYYPWDQTMRDAGYGILMVKTDGDPAALAAPLRGILRDLEPRAVVGRIETMDQVLEAEMAEPLRLRFFLGLFSLLGIVLGTVGVYGVVGYSVRRRQKEFGIRMALGARRSVLLGTVMSQGMLPVGIGVLAGTVAALVASSALARFLYGVRPSDPVSLAVAATVLLASGALAALIPAIRASRTDPAGVLRGE